LRFYPRGKIEDALAEPTKGPQETKGPREEKIMTDQTLDADLLPYPLPPWQHAFKSLAVYGEVDEDALRRLVPAPLELREPIAQFATMYFHSTVPKRPYFDAAVVVPVRYQGQDGGYWVHGFTSTDQVLSGTREIWGYRMKLADRITVDESGKVISGYTERLGKRLFSVELTPSDLEYDPPVTFPRLFLKMLPRADRAEPQVKTVIRMNAETTVESILWGEGAVSFEASEEDPVHRLKPKRILGASLTKGQQTLVWGDDLG